jgi:hypothetical protein
MSSLKNDFLLFAYFPTSFPSFAVGPDLAGLDVHDVLVAW